MNTNFTEPSHPVELKILFYAGFIVALPLTVVGNSLVIVAIAVNRCLRTTTNALLFSLSLADLPVGLFVFPMITIAQRYGPTLEPVVGMTLCHVAIFTTQVFLSASCLHLLLISADRYIAITIPLRYYELVTGYRVKLVIGFVWTLSVLAAVLPFTGWRHVRERTEGGFCQYHLNLDITYILFLHVTVCIVPLTLTCVAYCKIFRVARRQARKIASMDVSSLLRSQYGLCHATPPERCMTETITAAKEKDIGVSERERRQRRLEKERKITLTVAIVLGVFIICWGPLNILLLIYAVCEKCVSSLVVEGIEVFALMNSACNPLIYSVFSKDFRQAFKRLITCHCCGYGSTQVRGVSIALHKPP